MRWFGTLALIALLWQPPSFLQAEEFSQPAGTRRMAERLEEIAHKADPAKNPFLNEARAELIRQKLAEIKGQSEPSLALLLDQQARYGVELLYAGRSEQAIRELLRFEEIRAQGGSDIVFDRHLLPLVQTHLAVAYLRLGEQENCLSNHTTLSCIIPLDPTAVHSYQRGSRGAIHVLQQQLKENPTDLKARWLLNIAFMTVGEYPNKVPAPLLIPPEVFKSEYEIGRFPDVAGALGIDVPDLSGGSILEDFDLDGDLDIVASSIGLRDQLRFFINNGDGTFRDATMSAGLEGIVGGLNIVQTDYNNDGLADIFVLRGGWFRTEGKHPKSLLKNLGQGRFEDVTEAAGLLSPRPTQTAAWFDYDNDGWLDVFIGHESRDGDEHSCELYRNNGDGTFTECGMAAGVALRAWVKGVTSGDYDNDGRMDLYVSCLGEPNMLLRNMGPGEDGVWSFENVSRKAGVEEPLFSFPTWFFDYDNDGWLDLFVSGYRINNVGDVAADYLGLEHAGERVRLYRNRGDGRFEDVTRKMNLYKTILTMGCNFGDLDNDGFLDMYLGTGDPELGTLVPNRLLRNAGAARFQDVTTSAGLGQLQKGHGVSFGDLDHDGDQDIYHVLGGAYQGDTYRNALYLNPGHGNRWVKVKLEGVRANRMAIGARIEVYTTEAGAERKISRTVSSGGSFGASPLRQEIGLGAAEKIARIVIHWPGSGLRQTVNQPPMEKLLQVTEGVSGFEVIETPEVVFQTQSKADPHHHHHH